jgi:hypothetical protein
MPISLRLLPAVEGVVDDQPPVAPVGAFFPLRSRPARAVLGQLVLDEVGQRVNVEGIVQRALLDGALERRYRHQDRLRVRHDAADRPGDGGCEVRGKG